jgi:hypothetical protein
MLQIHFWADAAEYVAVGCAIVAIAAVVFYRFVLRDTRRDMLASPRVDYRFDDIPSIPRRGRVAAAERPLREDDVASVLRRVKLDLARLKVTLLEQKDVRIKNEVESELKSILMQTHPQVFAN